MQNFNSLVVLQLALQNVSVILALLSIHFILKYKRPISSTLKSAIPGIFSLVMLNLFDDFTGIKIPINSANLSISALLGIPGVGTVAILNTLFSI